MKLLLGTWPELAEAEEVIFNLSDLKAPAGLSVEDAPAGAFCDQLTVLSSRHRWL